MPGPWGGAPLKTVLPKERGLEEGAVHQDAQLRLRTEGRDVPIMRQQELCDEQKGGGLRGHLADGRGGEGRRRG